MIKNYVPLRDAKKVHVVELTHLFGGNKLVTRHVGIEIVDVQ